MYRIYSVSIVDIIKICYCQKFFDKEIDFIQLAPIDYLEYYSCTIVLCFGVNFDQIVLNNIFHKRIIFVQNNYICLLECVMVNFDKCKFCRKHFS